MSFDVELRVPRHGRRGSHGCNDSFGVVEGDHVKAFENDARGELVRTSLYRLPLPGQLSVQEEFTRLTTYKCHLHFRDACEAETEEGERGSSGMLVQAV